MKTLSPPLDADLKPSQKNHKEEIKKLLTSTKPVEMVIYVSDILFMFCSFLLFLVIFMTALNNYLQDFPDPIFAKSTIITGILLFVLGKHLQNPKKKRRRKKQMALRERLNKAAEKYLFYFLYFIYAISLSYIIYAFFSPEMGLQYSDILKDGVTEMYRFYYWLIIIAIPLFLLVITLSTTFFLLALLLKHSLILRIVFFILGLITLLGFRYILELDLIYYIDTEKANRLGTFLVGSLIIYLVRLLFFRQWIANE